MVAIEQPASDEEIDLDQNKGVVLQALNNKVSTKFMAFCQSKQSDQFLHACIAYFSAFFALQQLVDALASAAEAVKVQCLDPDDPLDAVTAQQAAVAAAEGEAEAARLGAEAELRMREVASVYSAILIRRSNYANTQQDRQFFETLYDFVARILFTCNERKRWHTIENELGRVFRSDHFNLARRKNSPAAQQTLLPHKQAFEQKRLAAATGLPPPAPPKRQPLALTAAVAMRSPVLSAVFPTAKEQIAREAARVRHAAKEASAQPGNAVVNRAAGERDAAPPAAESADDFFASMAASIDPREAMETQILAAADAFARSVDS